MNFRVLVEEDIPIIHKLEKQKYEELYPDETERMLKSWSSKAREESLKHYLPLGWSYGSFDSDGSLVGYFLGQMLLFFDGQTQSLWIEHGLFGSRLCRDQLCELAYKLAREKHLQRVYFPRIEGISNAISIFKPSQWGEQAYFINTTKVSS